MADGAAPDPELAVASVRTTVNGVDLEVAFGQLRPALAGGPLELRETITNRGDQAMSVPVGADRTRRRPAHLTVSATVEPGRVSLVDPWATVPYRGGIAGRTEVGPGASTERIVLVNDFVDLETLLGAVPEGAHLRVRLQLGRTIEPAGPPVVAELEVDVREDEAALARLVDDLAGTVATDPPASIADRERLVGLLATIPLAAASDALAGLAGNDSDAHLAGLAADAVLRRDRRTEVRGGGRV